MESEDMNQKHMMIRTVEDAEHLLTEIDDRIRTFGLSWLDDVKWSSPETRLYSRCFWYEFQKFVVKYEISLREVSSRLEKNPSSIAQMIYRNTFPTEKIIRPVMTELSHRCPPSFDMVRFDLELKGIERSDVIRTFLTVDRRERQRVLSEFVVNENNRNSKTLRFVIQELKNLDEGELKQVQGFVAALRRTSPHHQI